VNGRCIVRILLLAAAVMVCGCCGMSEETRDLAWGITQYQRAQAESLEHLMTGVVAKKVLTPAEAQTILETQAALVGSSQSLLEIVGMPKTLPELPGFRSSDVPEVELPSDATEGGDS